MLENIIFISACKTKSIVLFQPFLVNAFTMTHIPYHCVFFLTVSEYSNLTTLPGEVGDDTVCSIRPSSSFSTIVSGEGVLGEEEGEDSDGGGEGVSEDIVEVVEERDDGGDDG